jgi:hypothetical protein
MRRLLLLLPLLWLAPLGLVLTNISVPYVDAAEGWLGIVAAWSAVLLPIVAACACIASLRPLGWRVMAWLGLNVGAGFGAYAFVAILMFAT